MSQHDEGGRACVAATLFSNDGIWFLVSDCAHILVRFNIATVRHFARNLFHHDAMNIKSLQSVAFRVLKPNLE
jgi:hypothetical protein